MTMAPPFLWLVWTPAPPAPRPDADHGAASAGDKAADAFSFPAPTEVITSRTQGLRSSADPRGDPRSAPAADVVPGDAQGLRPHARSPYVRCGDLGGREGVGPQAWSAPRANHPEETSPARSAGP